MSQAPEGSTETEAAQRLQQAADRLKQQLSRVIVGQQPVIDELLTAMLAGGHALLVGVPGLAKTLMIRTLAATLDLTFQRIQFTPDLMPADITGTEVIQEDKATGGRAFRFLPGPIFAHVVLADEINRTPPKTQAALLEAMQELQVTVGGVRHALPVPFFVLATQNPIEQEGTYPLPEAQLDRFMFMIRVEYPTEEEEYEVVRQVTQPAPQAVEVVVTRDEWLHLQHLVRQVPVADDVLRYALQLSRSTRPSGTAYEWIKKYVRWGAGPRASRYLVQGAQARALLQGRLAALKEDVRAVALPVLRHRLVLNFHAEADGLQPDDLIQRLVHEVPEEAPPPRWLPPVFVKG
ncbi:MAG: ATPase AAA [Planctomycetaceae bacterium]|nr:MAG: ATPase AAA [Planctomycetaceae bacterium]